MDKEFALLLDTFEEYLLKYIELSRLLNHPVKDSIIIYYKDLRDNFNKLESLSVKLHFSLFKLDNKEKQMYYTSQNEAFNILFDDDLNKPACDNCKCSIF